MIETFRRSIYHWITAGALVLTGILVNQQVVAAQSEHIAGKVIDEQGKPVSGASVRITLIRNGDRSESKTNGNGDYIIANVSFGRYLVTATKDGYGSGQTTYELTRSDSGFANVTIRKIVP